MTTIERMTSLGKWTSDDLETMYWLGRPLVLSAEQMAALESGKDVPFDLNFWYAIIRLPRAAKPVATPPATEQTPRQWCRRCHGPLSVHGSDYCGEC